MACDLKPSCDFLFRYFCCAHPEDTIDVESTVGTVKGIHTFKKDHTTQSTTCSPQSRKIKPFPSFCRKMQAFIEEKRNENSPFSPILTQYTRNTVPTKRTKERPQKRSKSRKVDMECFTPSKVKNRSSGPQLIGRILDIHMTKSVIDEFYMYI